MKAYRVMALIAIVGLFGIGLQGCKKKGPSSAADAQSAPSDANGAGGLGTGNFDAANISSYTPENVIENLKLINIYFDFDQSSIKDQDRQFLKVLSQALKLDKNKNISIKIEGNCDERGSNEYNLALGERRARSVYDYLANLGVTKKRLDVVSFGEEKPAELGSNEAAWAKNRRAAFEVSK